MSRLCSHHVRAGEPVGNPPRRGVTATVHLQRETFTHEELLQVATELRCIADAVITVERALAGEFPPIGGGP